MKKTNMKKTHLSLAVWPVINKQVGKHHNSLRLIASIEFNDDEVEFLCHRNIT